MFPHCNSRNFIGFCCRKVTQSYGPHFVGQKVHFVVAKLGDRLKVLEGEIGRECSTYREEDKCI
jgi:hypothetical protein